MKRIFYTVLAILVLLIGIAFAVLNRQMVELNYYFGLKWSGPLSMALLAAFAFGVVAGYIASLRTVVRMQRQLVQARKEIRQIEQEVINLRSLPIKDVI
jgi:putative membrane protein